MTKTTRCHL